MRRVKVLFVCMGNICRSPTAQGVFVHMLESEGLTARVQVDSAGTHAYHVGSTPDERAQEAAGRRGIDLSDQRARIVDVSDFEAFDYVLAMDQDNREHLMDICPARWREKVGLLLDYAPDLQTSEVPDPYYGGGAGFERVLDLIEVASVGLIADIRRRFG